jgi:serine/threonine protein kinase
MAEELDELRAHAQTRVGTVLCGKYRLEGVLGLGGMATVYTAVHRNGRRVALKMLHPALSMNPDVRMRFLREGQAANAVNDPGAVIVIDDDVAEDGAAFIVMELLEGEVIEALWEQNDCRLPPRTVMAIGRELCTVLAAAHRAGIVHRDIKPENLFLTRDGRLKVLDFGLARVRDAMAPKMTHTGMVFGTPAFMAPEQASGRVSKIDAQTDIWAIGATMFTLVSGALVHQGETAQHQVFLAATKRARSVASVLPGAEEPLVSVIDRALVLEKKGRWPTADAMGEAIREASLMLFGEAEPELLGSGDLTRVQFLAPTPDLLPKAARRAGESSETEDYYPVQNDSSDTHEGFALKADSSDTEQNAIPRSLLETTIPDAMPRAIESSDEEDALTRVRGSSPDLRSRAAASISGASASVVPEGHAFKRPAPTPGWGSPHVVTPGGAQPIAHAPEPDDFTSTLRRLVGAIPRGGRRRLRAQLQMLEPRSRDVPAKGGVAPRPRYWVGLGSGAAAVFVLAVLFGAVLHRGSTSSPTSPSASVEPQKPAPAPAVAATSAVRVETEPPNEGAPTAPPTASTGASAAEIPASAATTNTLGLGLALPPNPYGADAPRRQSPTVASGAVPVNPGVMTSAPTLPAQRASPAKERDSARSGLNCNPPYSVNSDGKVLWKAECLKSSPRGNAGESIVDKRR